VTEEPALTVTAGKLAEVARTGGAAMVPGMKVATTAAQAWLDLRLAMKSGMAVAVAREYEPPSSRTLRCRPTWPPFGFGPEVELFPAPPPMAAIQNSLAMVVTGAVTSAVTLVPVALFSWSAHRTGSG